jgi:two-component system cell cycle response regulator DivK
MSENTSGKTVLIVEDNELNAKLFRDLLLSRGHRILATAEGREAIRLARVEKPDLILMDIQLPEISGFDLIQMIKADAELLSIPIIAITAFAMKGDEEKIRSSGCEDYLSKPISVGKFLATVEKHLSAV